MAGHRDWQVSSSPESESQVLSVHSGGRGSGSESEASLRTMMASMPVSSLPVRPPGTQPGSLRLTVLSLAGIWNPDPYLILVYTGIY